MADDGYDFVNQETINKESFAPPDDNLGHDGLAESLLERLKSIGTGKVLAVQGPWGRGKTDVLLRMAHKEKQRIQEDEEVEFDGTDEADVNLATPLWINPWQYGTPDLLTPLVTELATRAKRVGEADSYDIKQAGQTLLSAGLNFGAKAAGVGLAAAGMPFVGSGVQATGEAAGSLMDEILEGDNDTRMWDVDPVASMSAAFRDLVDEAMPAEMRDQGGRLLVFIDDLDRCLPDKQVALLEAVRFLTSGSPEASFVFALDPKLARQSVAKRYEMSTFEADRYLDKMFHLRVNLPQIDEVRDFFERKFEEEVYFGGVYRAVGDILSDAVEIDRDEILDLVDEALEWSVLRNPRIIERALQRLWLLAKSSPDLNARGEEELKIWIGWLALVERWPDLRDVLKVDQPADQVSRRLAECFYPQSDQETKRSKRETFFSVELPTYNRKTSHIYRAVDRWNSDAPKANEDDKWEYVDDSLSRLEAQLRMAGL